MKGIAASDGIGFAKAYKLIKPDLSFEKKIISDSQAAHEIDRLKEALASSRDDLRKIIDHTQQTMGKESADVFRAHLEIVSDPEFIGEVNTEIKESKVNAEAALQVVTDSTLTCSKP